MEVNGTLGGAAAQAQDGATTTGGQGGQTVNSPDWGFVPEGMRSLTEGHASTESFWANVNDALGLVRERQSVTGMKPDSLVSEEDWNKAFAALGKPDSPDGYKLPESWQDEKLAPETLERVNQMLGADKSAIMNAFHAANLTGRQAEALYNVLGNVMAESVAAEAAAQKPVAETLKELWGEDAPRHLDTAKRGAALAGIGNELDEAGLSQHPLVLKLAHALGERGGEGAAPGVGAGASVLPTGQAALDEMYRVIGSDAYRSNDPEAIRKVEALSRRVDMA